MLSDDIRLLNIQYEEASDNEYEEANDNCSDSKSDCSFDAPPYGPISEYEFCDANEDRRSEETNTPENENQQLEYFQPTEEVIDSNWTGFKIVGDNLDKNIHPSFSRSDNATRSLHYFHYYAVLDTNKILLS